MSDEDWLSDEERDDLEWSRRAIDEAERKRYDDEMLPWRREARKPNGPANGEAPQKPAPLRPTATPLALPESANIRPRQFLYRGHYIRDYATGTISPGGFGKTALALSEMINMALAGLRVWYISGEDDIEEVWRRVAAYCDRARVSRELLAGKLFVDDRETFPLVIAKEGRNGGPELNEDHLAALMAAIMAGNIDVIILDPLISFHECVELNVVFDRIAKRLNKVCRPRNCNIEILHHTRKIPFGQEITVDDARGGGALVNAWRSVRVLNRMTVAEAETARIKKEDRFRYRQIDNGKRNIAPPETAKWVRLASVMLANGDNVQAVEPWEFPKTFGQVSITDQDWVRDLARYGKFRVSSQSPNWLGHELAKKYDRDVNVEGDRIWIAKILKAWVENGVLKKVDDLDEKGMKRPFYAAGNAENDPGEEAEA